MKIFCLILSGPYVLISSSNERTSYEEFFIEKTTKKKNDLCRGTRKIFHV